MRRVATAFAVVALLSASGASTTAAASSGAPQRAAVPGITLGVAGVLDQATGGRKGGGGGGGGGGASTTGYDISWPQCGKTLPSGQAFGIVGMNGGLANTLNPCLTSELAWAWGSTGNSKLPKAALYVNTANAGPNLATKWPTSGTNRYGTCTTLAPDSQACAWEYGAAFATQDMQWLADTATALSALGVSGLASDYTWWLDVETVNSWETGTAGLANNVADLQAMVATFEAAGAKVGIYSTSYQWGVITGGSTDYNLNGLSNWIPGARRQSSAQSNCSLPSFTGGAVAMTQWFGNPYDGDVAC